jgi:hypothetical protein
MRLQIDTIDRTVAVVDKNVNLGELISFLENLLPEWKSYTLIKVEKNDFDNPIIIKEIIREQTNIPNITPYYPNIQPYYNPFIITSGNGTFNVETDYRTWE